jgi:type I restriction enzyme R subunit
VNALHRAPGCPRQEPEGQGAKRFDLLLLELQLAVLSSDPGFDRLSQQVKGIASLLEEKSSVPLVQKQPALIQELQSDEWWENVTPELLESVRRQLRLLVKLIDKRQRKPLYTNFEDERGAETNGRATDVRVARQLRALPRQSPRVPEAA